MTESTQSAQPIEIFISYSHKDENLRDQLLAHLANLRRQGLITEWHDRKILPATEWADEIDKHLNSAQVILLLVSSDFIASDYCYGAELQRAMQRHEAGEARVIPVILRPVELRGTPFMKLQALPKNAKPVTTWSSRDKALIDIAQGVRKVVEEIQRRLSTVSSSSNP